MKTDELIRPILRGRDIRRYGYDFADLWLINTHNGIKEKGIPPIDINDYPAIKKHLDQYWETIEKRADQGYTPYNLRNCAYMEDFYKQKIAWASVGVTLYSKIDSEQFLLDTNYFFSTENSDYLLAILNSKLIIAWINSEDTPIGGGGAFRHYKYNLEKLSIPQLSKIQQKPFIELIKQILERQKQNENTYNLEKQIDQKVYKLYNLTDEEIVYIEEV